MLGWVRRRELTKPSSAVRIVLLRPRDTYTEVLAEHRHRSTSYIKRMTRASSVLVLSLVLAGCGITGPTGERCGGAQLAVARAALPDTGIGAGAPVTLVFTQRDPYLIGEQVDITLWHHWPQDRDPNPEADPRVRLVRDDGTVLLDTPSGRTVPNAPTIKGTWGVTYFLRNATTRDALFEAMRDERLWLELWHRDASAPGTRVKLATEQAYVEPISRCA